MANKCTLLRFEDELDERAAVPVEIHELEELAGQALQDLLEAYSAWHGDGQPAERALQRYLAYFAINYLGCQVNDAHRISLDVYPRTVH